MENGKWSIITSKDVLQKQTKKKYVSCWRSKKCLRSLWGKNVKHDWLIIPAVRDGAERECMTVVSSAGSLLTGRWGWIPRWKHNPGFSCGWGESNNFSCLSCPANWSQTRNQVLNLVLHKEMSVLTVSQLPTPFRNLKLVLLVPYHVTMRRVC